MSKITDKDQIASEAFNEGYNGQGSPDMCTYTYEDKGDNWEIWSLNWNQGRMAAEEEDAAHYALSLEQGAW